MSEPTATTTHQIEPETLKAGLKWALITLALLAGLRLAYHIPESDTLRYHADFTDPALSQDIRWLKMDPDLFPGTSDYDNGKKQPIRATGVTYNPIIRWAKVKQIIYEGTPYYYSTDLLWHSKMATAKYNYVWIKDIALLVAVLLTFIATVILIHYDSFYKKLIGVLLLRVVALCAIFSFFDFFTIHANDETLYIKISQKLLNWDMQLDDYSYSIGLPLLYTPLSAMWPSASTYKLAALMTPLNFIVFGLGTLATLAAMFKRLSIKPSIAIGVLGCIALYPVVTTCVTRVVDDVFLSATYLGQAIPLTPDHFWIGTFYASDMLAYNGLSDTPALCLALLSILFTLKGVDAKRWFFVAGLIWGFSCMVRVSNIFVALPILWILIQHDKRQILSGLLLGAIGFVMAFSPQLAWNYALFDNPFLMGYHIREEDYKGFQLSLFTTGLNYLGHQYFQLMACYTLALWHFRHHHQKLVGAFACLMLGLTIFYCGYHAFGQNPVRFILIPLYAMLAIVFIWIVSLDKPQRRLALIALLLPLIILPHITLGAFLIKLPGWVGPCVYSLTTLIMIKKKEWAYALFFIVMAIGNVYVCAMLCLLGTLLYILNALYTFMTNADGESEPNNVSSA